MVVVVIARVTHHRLLHAPSSWFAELAPREVELVAGLDDAALADLLGRADLFVMPSLIEGFGLVYIEALSLGTPILYTDESGPADFCTSGVQGFKVPLSDAEAIRDVLAAAAAEPRRLRAMRPACAAAAAGLSWAAFREGVSRAIGDGERGR